MKPASPLTLDDQWFSRRKSVSKVLSDSPTEAVAIVDADGNIRSVSPSITPLSGWLPDELVGQEIATLISLSDWELARDSTCASDGERSRVRARAARTQLEILVTCRDASVLVCNVSVLPMTSLASATEIQFVCLLRERTRDADQGVDDRRISTMQRALMNALLDPVITIDARGTIRLASASVEKVFGWTPEELLGQNISVLMPEPHRSNHDVYLERYRQTGIPRLLGVAREMEAVRKDGSTFMCEVNATRVDIPGAPEPFFTGILRDTTERHQLLERAVAASTAKSNFLATMSHEIRTPMNAILGFSNRLLEDDLTPQQRRRATFIRDAGVALLDLINNILDLSKIEADKLTLDAGAFNLSELIRHTVEMVRPITMEKSLEINCSIDARIPQCLRGDEARIRQVFMNLFGNAAKFTEKGSISITAILADADEEFALVRIYVSDTGIGIPPDRQREIFEPFVQANNVTTRRYGGTGLGLTITKRLIEMMGGSLKLKSEPGHGSTFSVTLPLPLAAPGESGASHSADPSTAKSSRTASPESRPRATDKRCLSGIRILYAEDNEANGLLAQEVLEEAGARVDLAIDGHAALKLLREQAYDVALVDIQMPEADGFHVVRETRKQEETTGAHLRMIALTAFAMRGDREKCLNHGFDDYHTKPFDGPRLVALVQRYAASSAFASERTRAIDNVKHRNVATQAGAK